MQGYTNVIDNKKVGKLACAGDAASIDCLRAFSAFQYYLKQMEKNEFICPNKRTN